MTRSSRRWSRSCSHSSLAHLSRLPVDEIKIDHSFVGRMSTDPTSAFIVRSTVDLGHSLGLTVVAEGIEDAQTWDALLELGCDVGQGYFVGRPQPAEDIVTWLGPSAEHAERA